MSADDRRAWWLWGGGVLAVALLTLKPADPGDSWMYAATGRWILDNHTIPHTDPLSWTYAGQPWQSNGWGWGVIADAAYRVGGFTGLTVLKPLFVGLIAAAILFATRSFGARLVPAMTASVGAVLLIQPWIVERPQLASLALFPLTIGLAARATHEDRLQWGWLAVLAGAFVLWANLHSVVLQGALVTVVFLAAQGVVAFVRDRSVRVLVPSGAAAAIVVVCSFITPFGLSTLSYSSRIREISKATITEWFPVWRGGPDAVIPGIALVATVIAVVWLRAWRRPELLAPVVVGWVLTIDAIRNGPYLVITIVVFLTPLLPAVVVPAAAGRRDLATVAVAVGLLCSVVVTGLRIKDVGAPGPLVPVAASDALPAGCRLRNDYQVGGWLLFRRPDVPVSVDGRNDLYGIAGYDQQRFFETAGGAAEAPAAFRAEGVNCVIAVPGEPVIDALTRAGWRIAAQDSGGVLLLPGS